MPQSIGYGQIPVVANGNVSPRRFIVGVTGAGNGQRAVQATGSTACYLGISSDWLRYPPNSPQDDGYIAVAGENLAYAGPGMTTNLDIGATDITNCGLPVKSDASGKGVVTTTDKDAAGAIARQAGVSGDIIEVDVIRLQLSV